MTTTNEKRRDRGRPTPSSSSHDSERAQQEITFMDELALVVYPVSDPAVPPSERLDRLQDADFTVDLLTDRRCRELFMAIVKRVEAGKITDLTHVQDLTSIDFMAVVEAAGSLFDHQLPGRIADLKERYQARQIERIVKQAGTMHPSEALEYLRDEIDRIGGTQVEFAAVKATDYISHLPPVNDPVLVDLFDLGDKCWLIGSSKARKSFFALMLAIAVATGNQFMVWQVAKARRVLLVQLEIKGDHFHRRVNRMARSMHVTEIDNLTIVNGRGANIDMAAIRRLAIKHKSEFILIDPLYKLLDGDENSAEVMGRVMRQVDQIAEATGAAVMIVHHERKGHAGDRQAVDRGAGSGTLARDYDAAIYLAAHATEEDTIVISSIARNYAPTEPFTAIWDEGCFVESNAAPVEATSGSARRQAGKRPAVSDMQVIQIVETEGPFTTELLTRRLQGAGCTRELAKETPRRLISEGLLAEHKERKFHGCRWVGTPGQIHKKQAQSDQSDGGDQSDGLSSVCESAEFPNV